MACTKRCWPLEKYLHECSLEEPLIHLIKLRVSQINGCAYCIDMHWKDLRALGETEQRLYGLDAWEESPYYSDRERAALAWAEAVTNLHDGHVPDEVFEYVHKHFSDKEIADLTLAVGAINAWNRLAIAARSVPGHYQPAKPREMKTSPDALVAAILATIVWWQMNDNPARWRSGLRPWSASTWRMSISRWIGRRSPSRARNIAISI